MIREIAIKNLELEFKDKKRWESTAKKFNYSFKAVSNGNTSTYDDSRDRVAGVWNVKTSTGWLLHPSD